MSVLRVTMLVAAGADTLCACVATTAGATPDNASDETSSGFAATIIDSCEPLTDSLPETIAGFLSSVFEMPDDFVGACILVWTDLSVATIERVAKVAARASAGNSLSVSVSSLSCRRRKLARASWVEVNTVVPSVVSGSATPMPSAALACVVSLLA
jgi:hypothetical protein